jgi:hypothetical protein
MWDAEIRRFVALKQTREKKSTRPHLSGKKLGTVACICHLSYRRKHKLQKLQCRPAWAKNEILSQK